MDDAGNIFTKKLGPLPVWGWVAVFVVGYLAFDWWRSHHAAATPAAATSGSVGGYTNARSPSQYVTGTGKILTPSTGNIIGTAGSGSNGGTLTGLSWIQKAIMALGSIGYKPTTVNSALQAYASGGTLNKQQYNIITAAEKLIGSGPFGSPRTPTLPTPVPSSGTGKTGKTTPTAGRTVSGHGKTGRPSIAGTFQIAPTDSVFAATGYVYSPIATWTKTLQLLSQGIKVYLKTKATGLAYLVTEASLKAIEHTATHAFTQYTTYTEASTPALAKSGPITAGPASHFSNTSSNSTGFYAGAVSNLSSGNPALDPTLHLQPHTTLGNATGRPIWAGGHG